MEIVFTNPPVMDPEAQPKPVQPSSSAPELTERPTNTAAEESSEEEPIHSLDSDDEKPLPVPAQPLPTPDSIAEEIATEQKFEGELNSLLQVLVQAGPNAAFIFFKECL